MRFIAFMAFMALAPALIFMAFIGFIAHALFIGAGLTFITFIAFMTASVVAGPHSSVFRERRAASCLASRVR